VVDMSGKSKTEDAWKWMCQQEKFALSELIEQTDLNNGAAYEVLKRWIGWGHVRCVKEKVRGKSVSFRSSTYQVINPQEPPNFGSGNRVTTERRKKRFKRKTYQQKMWNTMKISRHFKPADLSITAGVSVKSAARYIRLLMLAGYIQQMDRGEIKPVSERSYLLIRDTGRLSPMVRANPSGCWDQNQKRLYPFLVEEGEHGNVA
jgi:hypothetical protein